jgi:type 1 glutamine amidotransferase
MAGDDSGVASGGAEQTNAGGGGGSAGDAALGGATSSAGSGGAADPGPMRVLLFTEVSGVNEAHDVAPWDHMTRDIVATALAEMALDQGFEVLHTSDSAGYFTSESLSNYDVVIFASTTGTPLDAAEQLAFEGFIGAGGGYVGIHAAADCHYNWQWYGGLVGGIFLTHAQDPNIEAATVLRQNDSAPATAHLEPSFSVTDEWYTFREMDLASLDVLLTVEESSYLAPGEIGLYGEPCEMADAIHPIAWRHEYGGGRSFYTNFGHVAERYADPWFREHLWGGMLYAAGRE